MTKVSSLPVCGRLLRHRLRGFRRVAHAAVRRQLVRLRVRLRRAPASRSPSRSTRSSTSSKRRCRRSGSSISSQVRGAATVGSFASAHRIRRDRRLRRTVLAPVEEHLACAQALGHRRGDLFGHRLFQLLGDALRQHRRATGTDRLGQRHIEVQALAAAGQRIRRQPDVGDEAPYLVRHLAQLTERDVVAGIEVEHDARGGPGIFSAPRSRLHESTNRHCGTCTSSDACCAIHANPSTAVDDRIRRGAGPVRDGRRGPASRVRRLASCFSKKDGSSTPLGQRLRVTARPAMCGIIASAMVT